MAAALIGGVQMLLGAIGSGAASLMTSGTALPLAIVMSACTLSAPIVAWKTLTHPRAVMRA